MEKLSLSVFLNARDKTSPTLTKVGGSLDKLAHKANAVGKSLTKIGVASTAMGSAMLAPLGATFNAYQDLARAQGEVASLGVAKEGLDAITKSAREFSNQFAGTSASDFVRASYDIKSGIASLSDTAVGEFTKISALTASATKSSTAEMTSLFATGFGIYRGQFESFGASTIEGWNKLSAEEKDIKFGEYFSAGISSSVQAFKTDGANMSSALANLGASATSAGISFAEQLSILGQLQATMSGSEASTKYRAFLSSVGSAGEKLGLQFTDANDQLLTMPEIITTIKDKYGDTIDAVESQELKKAFGTEEAVALVKLLYNETDTLTSNIDSMSGSLQNGTQKTLEMAKATNKGKEFELLSQKMGNVTTLIGQSFAPIALKLGTIIGDVTTKVGAWIEKNPELTSMITTGIAIVGGLAVALGTFAMISGAVAMAMPALATGIGFASTAFTFLGGVVTAVGKTFLLNPIGLAVTGIATLAYLLYDNWGGVKSFFSGLWDGVKNTFNSVWSFIRPIVDYSPFGVVSNNWNNLTNFFGGLWSGISNTFDSVWNFIRPIVEFSPIGLFFQSWSPILDFFSNLWSNIASGASEFFGWIVNKISSIGEVVGKVKSFFGFGGDDEKSQSPTKVGASVNNTAFKPTQAKMSIPKKAIASTAIASSLVAGQPSQVSNTTNQPIQKKVEQHIQVSFGDIKVESLDGKINNPQQLQAQIQQAVETALANINNDRNLSDEV